MRRVIFAAVAIGALAASLGAVTAAQATNAMSVRDSHICAAATQGIATCNAIRRDVLDSHGKPAPNVTPSGFKPADIVAAYGLGGGAGHRCGWSDPASACGQVAGAAWPVPQTGACCPLGPGHGA